MEEIYDSNRFDKQEMLTWEQHLANIKTNYDEAKTYFKCIVEATNTYKQNKGGSTTTATAMNRPTKWRTMATKFGSTSSS